MKMKFTLFITALLLSVASFAQTPVATAGTKYVLIMEETGAWCGYCPDGKTYLDQILTSTPHAIAVSFHDTALGWTPGYENLFIPEGDAYVNTAGYLGSPSVGGYPAATIDCVPGTDGYVGQNRGYWSTCVNTRLSASPMFDITMTHSYAAATRKITINVTAKTLAAISGAYNINVIVSEDSITSMGPNGSGGNLQHSYLYNTSGQPYYMQGTVITAGSVWGLASPIYYHDGVVRAMLGSTWGTTGVIANNAPSGATYTKQYTYTVPATQNTSHIKLTAYVQKSNAANANDRGIPNAIQAKLVTTASVAEVVSNISDVEVYPSPATNVVNVKATVPENAMTNIAISNMVGQTVFSNNYKANGNLISENLSLDNLSSGIYFINISGEGFSSVQKLTVNK
jgi:hypothetical protein